MLASRARLKLHGRVLRTPSPAWARPSVDHITLSRRALVLAKGVARYRELLGWLRQQSPVPATTSPQAFADGLKYLGATKLAVATSFIPAHNQLVKEFLMAEGFDVVAIEGLDTGMTSIEKAMLSPQQVFEHVRDVGRRHPDCDAMLITSSAWPTLAVIQALEDAPWQTGGQQRGGTDLGTISRSWYQGRHSRSTASCCGSLAC